jgi:hypothetical protein
MTDTMKANVWRRDESGLWHATTEAGYSGKGELLVRCGGRDLPATR